MLPIYLSGSNIKIQGTTGIGKTLAMLIAMAETTDQRILLPQALCLVASFESAISLKATLDAMIKYTCIESKIIHHNQVWNNLTVHEQILIGTPQEMCRLVSERKISVNEIKLICIDDADVSGQWQEVGSMINKFSNKKFIVASTYPVQFMAQLIPDLVCPCEIRKGFTKKMMHFYAIADDLRSKMKQLTELLQSQQLKDQIIVFCSVSKIKNNLYYKNFILFKN